jgi:hypothetical protein
MNVETRWPRVFNLSLHRSGTQSFSDFAQRNDLKCLHWPGQGFDLLCRSAVDTLDLRYVWGLYRKIIVGFDAIADIPAPILYQDLIDCFPEGHFFLVLRDPRKWIESVRRHVGNRELDALEKMQYWLAAGEKFGDRLSVDDSTLADLYARYNAKVEMYAKQKNVKFRNFSIDDPQIGRKLCDFIGVSKSDTFRLVDIAKQ